MRSVEIDVFESSLVNELSKKTEVVGKKISVIGAARSGVAVAHLLKTKGAIVFVSDKLSEDKLRPQISELKSLEIDYELNGHTEHVLNADIIVVSPGVPSNNPIIQEATRRAIKIISELEAASWFCPAPIVAVTGTNGKTTTTTLIGKVLDETKKKHIVAGNIGTAFSSSVNKLDAGSVAVLEVSSFQLDYIETFHPKVSIILNITPDHLDRYDHDFEKYVVSKCRIFENQTKNDFLIYNYDDEETRKQVKQSAGSHVRTLPFSTEHKLEGGAFVEDGRMITILNNERTEILEAAQIGIRGIHNLYNSMAATLAGQLMGVSTASLSAALREFKGVEHRLEFVREINGVRYINDSKATNVDSVWYALQAYGEPLIVLIGGRDKGNDYSKLFELVKQHVKTIIAIGESAEKVYQEFYAITKVVKANSMEEAVNEASKLAVGGDIVLLSPACASFDWFQNYEHRGQVFKQLINSL